MNNYKFLIDSLSEINPKDLANLRTFYTPIIGSNGIVFYHYLYDLYSINKTDNQFQDEYDLYETLDFLVLDFDILENTKNKLEAIGLIKTYQNRNGNLLFRLVRPLNANEIANNLLIRNLLEKKIGVDRLKELIKKHATYSFDENKLINISKNFFEIFNDKNINLKSKDIFDFKYLNEFELLNNLSAEEFINHFTKKELSPTQLLMLKKIKNLNFDDKAINCIIKYSININNSIVCSYIEKIANDFAKRDLFEANIIDHELSQAINFKRNNAHYNLRILNKNSNNQESNDSSSKNGLIWDD